MPDLTEKMRQWRDGLLSIAEITAFLLEALCEVNVEHMRAETETAERTFKKV